MCMCTHNHTCIYSICIAQFDQTNAEMLGVSNNNNKSRFRF